MKCSPKTQRHLGEKAQTKSKTKTQQQQQQKHPKNTPPQKKIQTTKTKKKQTPTTATTKNCKRTENVKNNFEKLHSILLFCHQELEGKFYLTLCRKQGENIN